MEYSIQSTPVPVARGIKGRSMLCIIGGVFYTITPLFIFSLVLNEITREKELRLR
jgi:hypothetical protein